MDNKLIDGRKLAKEWQSEIKKAVSESGLKPCVALVLVGSDPASALYVKKKEVASQEVGIKAKKLEFPEDMEQEDLLQLVEELNNDPGVHGIMVEFPLPKQISPLKVLEAIYPEKDVDGLHPLNQGKNLMGSWELSACTARGAMKLIESTGVDLKGKNAVMVGTSNIVGKPLGLMLLNSGATVSYCNKNTQDLASFTKNADVLVVAVGKPKLITKEMVKPGAVVIDVGINKVEGKVAGDVDFEGVKEVASHITPVPGGVGPMTVSCLLENVLIAAKNLEEKK